MSKIRDQVFDLGEDVLNTPEFREAFEKTHHHKSNIAQHSIRVACVSLAIAIALKKIGADMDRKMLVQAALSHDMGMLKREDYKSTKDQYRHHPHDAVPFVEQRLGIRDPKMNNAIEAHMYPINRKFAKPKSKEAAVLSIADKAGSLADLISRRNKITPADIAHRRFERQKMKEQTEKIKK